MPLLIVGSTIYMIDFLFMFKLPERWTHTSGTLTHIQIYMYDCVSVCTHTYMQIHKTYTHMHIYRYVHKGRGSKTYTKLLINHNSKWRETKHKTVLYYLLICTFFRYIGENDFPESTNAGLLRVKINLKIIRNIQCRHT